MASYAELRCLTLLLSWTIWWKSSWVTSDLRRHEAQVPEFTTLLSNSHCRVNLAFIMMAIITLKHFPRYWPFVWGIHRSTLNSPHKVQWHWALTFPLIHVWANGWVNNRDAGGLIRHGTHYDVTDMCIQLIPGLLFVANNQSLLVTSPPGGRLNKKDGLTRYGDPMLKIRRPNGRLIFNMEIAIYR